MTRAGERNRWLHEHKLCVSCKQQDAFTLNGRWRCAECSEKLNQRHREIMAQDPEKRYQTQKAYREDHKARGLCVQCTRPAVSGETMCRYHKDKNRRRKRAEYQKTHDTGSYGQTRCHYCKAETAGEFFCPECKKRAIGYLEPTWRKNSDLQKNSYYRKSMELFYQKPNA